MVFMNLVWILRTTKEERERRHAIACSQNFLVLIKRERTSNSALFIKVRCVAYTHIHLIRQTSEGNRWGRKSLSKAYTNNIIFNL